MLKSNQISQSMFEETKRNLHAPICYLNLFLAATLSQICNIQILLHFTLFWIIWHNSNNNSNFNAMHEANIFACTHPCAIKSDRHFVLLVSVYGETVSLASSPPLLLFLDEYRSKFSNKLCALSVINKLFVRSFA